MIALPHILAGGLALKVGEVEAARAASGGVAQKFLPQVLARATQRGTGCTPGAANG